MIRLVINVISLDLTVKLRARIYLSLFYFVVSRVSKRNLAQSIVCIANWIINSCITSFSIHKMK